MLDGYLEDSDVGTSMVVERKHHMLRQFPTAAAGREKEFAKKRRNPRLVHPGRG